MSKSKFQEEKDWAPSAPPFDASPGPVYARAVPVSQPIPAAIEPEPAVRQFHGLTTEESVRSYKRQWRPCCSCLCYNVYCVPRGSMTLCHAEKVLLNPLGCCLLCSGDCAVPSRHPLYEQDTVPAVCTMLPLVAVYPQFDICTAPARLYPDREFYQKGADNRSHNRTLPLVFTPYPRPESQPCLQRLGGQFNLQLLRALRLRR
mmetsp:Transcript_21543/g.65840  ORF Transcript_21543/g.65840 Transcript_21543/m.65840 type:complete len:203 (-) Transcript_21543:190-798(-)